MCVCAFLSQCSSSCVARISGFAFAHASHFVNTLSKTSCSCNYSALKDISILCCVYHVHWFCLCILCDISDLKIGRAVLPVVVNTFKHLIKMWDLFGQLHVLSQEYRVGLLLIKDPKSC